MLDNIDLTVVWALIIAFAVFAYIVMDGFDLGIGILFPAFRPGHERDTAMNSIAPVWDGNETWLILGGGGLYVIGILLAGVNFFMTIRTKPKVLEVPVYEAPALTRLPKAGKTYTSDLQNVIGLGRKSDEFLELSWHRRYEGLPVKFTIGVIITVVVASLFEAVPIWLVEANRPKVAWIKPYTPLEQYGRDVYIAEGCYNCHSQMIRPMRHETERYGPYSVAEESAYDHPFQWGSKRTGPDLARVGGTRNHLWHWDHFQNPRQITPGSIMPQYD